jgi:hypothetical protein
VHSSLNSTGSSHTNTPCVDQIEPASPIASTSSSPTAVPSSEAQRSPGQIAAILEKVF